MIICGVRSTTWQMSRLTPRKTGHSALRLCWRMQRHPMSGMMRPSKYIDGIVNRANKMLILVDLNIRLSEAEWGHIAEL